MSAPPAPYSETPIPERGAPAEHCAPSAHPDPLAPEPAPAATSEPTPAPTGPTGRTDAPPRVRERLAWYAGSTLLALVLAVCGMQLWNRDLRAPFYYDLDALLYLPLARTTVEHGSHWTTDRLGAPGRQELYDFPVIDYLHFGLLWLIGRATSDILLVYNIYSLLTYPLTALTAMWVLRRLGLALPTAALGGLLYAFLPYHQERYQYHYFLAAYWWVPVSLVPALALCRGEFPFFARRPDGGYRWHLRSRGAAWTVLAGAVTACAGAYYAFFACAAYAFAGVYAWAVYGTWRGAAAAALVIAPVVAVGVAGHLPAYLYQREFGVNPLTRRSPDEADSYGLKVAHLLLPATDHNFRPFANLRAKYCSPDRPAEAERAGSLGLIGGAGLIALLVAAVLPNRRRRWPTGALVGLTLALVLLGTIGAFGSLFNLLVSPQIRAYNRVGVFVAFLCQFAALGWVERYLLTRPRVPVRYVLWATAAAGCAGLFSPLVIRPDAAVLAAAGVALFGSAAVLALTRSTPDRGRLPRFADRLYRASFALRYYPTLAALLVVGYVDQTPWGWNPLNPHGMAAIDAFAERFRADKDFFRRIEEAAPGARVFCLPYAAFPESPPVYQMGGYEHARGYVMTDTLSWSYGAIRGREADAWQRDVAELLGRTKPEPEQMLERIVARGFDGLLIDGRGFPPLHGTLQPKALIKRLNYRYQAEIGHALAELPETVHDDGRQFFLDLRPFRDAWRDKNPAAFAARERAEREWLATLWIGGFQAFEPTRKLIHQTFWGPFDATVVFVNPAARTRTIDFTFVIGTVIPGPLDMTLSGLVTESFQLDKSDADDTQDIQRLGQPMAYRLELPPGRSHIHFRCRPPSYFLPLDRTNLCYFIEFVTVEEKP